MRKQPEGTKAVPFALQGALNTARSGCARRVRFTRRVSRDEFTT